MTAPQAIIELVERFERNRDDYKSGKYNETQARREFVDPMFKALGWDVDNEQGYAEAYKDVIHEAEVKVEGKAKAPDYSFRIGGTRKFFVEAKKPSVFVKEDIAPAFQVRRYGWSAKLPLSLVTDFEEFAVYDCRIKPVNTDKASTARIMYLTYDQYTEKWDEIAGVFSRDAILKGSFDRFADSAKGKRGTAEVDAEFLKEIEKWRDKLARDIALRNRELSQGEINYAVQMTIDRLIFLRICEDRGIEPYQQLHDLLKAKGVYQRLCDLFRQADDRYNSGLFHFREEKGRGHADGWTLGLGIDDDTLVTIIRGLYYPTSPYEFSVMPASVLGQVYEQFLGKVIRLTAGHRASVEDKPEVKKAGGVYYTPDYIVAYIVKNTVGKLLEGKTPAEVTPMRILDPACGSGSFLIGAYQTLLDWHLDWYLADGAEQHTAQVYQAGANNWRLTTGEKKRILINNIYGVDIDAQAVEVTKLSLLLKVLEGETQETIGTQMRLFKERALPDLGSNVKCGNSLIGTDYGLGVGKGLKPLASQGGVSEEEWARINPFDWEREFPEAFRGEQRALWFVTFVTHNSRVSERMVTYGVVGKGLKGKGLKPLVFTAEDQVLIAEKIADACRRYAIPMTALNVLPDHVHMIVAAKDESELNELVRKIKGYSSHEFQKARAWEAGQHVWAQKFNRAAIKDEDALRDITEYVENNHLKHVERWGEYLIEVWDKGLKPLVSAACVSPDEAITQRGGFDAVIGNPPYIRIQALKEWAPLEVEFYKSAYTAASKGNYDIYVVFVERGLQLLNANGLLGFILPHKFFNAQYGEALRGVIAEGKHLAGVVHFGDQQIFSGATTYTCLMFLSKAGVNYLELIKVNDLGEWQLSGIAITANIPTEAITEAEWNFSAGQTATLFEKLRQTPTKLGHVASRMAQGIRTSANEVYVLDLISENGAYITAYSKQLGQNVTIEREITSLFLQGREIKPYRVMPSGKVVIIPYRIRNEQTELIPENELRKNFSKTYAYLLENKTYLEAREHGRMRVDGWYGYVYPKNIDVMASPKILIPDIAR